MSHKKQMVEVAKTSLLHPEGVRADVSSLSGYRNAKILSMAPLNKGRDSKEEQAKQSSLSFPYKLWSGSFQQSVTGANSGLSQPSFVHDLSSKSGTTSETEDESPFKTQSYGNKNKTRFSAQSQSWDTEKCKRQEEAMLESKNSASGELNGLNSTDDFYGRRTVSEDTLSNSGQKNKTSFKSQSRSIASEKYTRHEDTTLQTKNSACGALSSSSKSSSEKSLVGLKYVENSTSDLSYRKTVPEDAVSLSAKKSFENKISVSVETETFESKDKDPTLNYVAIVKRPSTDVSDLPGMRASCKKKSNGAAFDNSPKLPAKQSTNENSYTSKFGFFTRKKKSIKAESVINLASADTSSKNGGDANSTLPQRIGLESNTSNESNRHADGESKLKHIKNSSIVSSTHRSNNTGTTGIEVDAKTSKIARCDSMEYSKSSASTDMSRRGTQKVNASKHMVSVVETKQTESSKNANYWEDDGSFGLSDSTSYTVSSEESSTGSSPKANSKPPKENNGMMIEEASERSNKIKDTSDRGPENAHLISNRVEIEGGSRSLDNQSSKKESNRRKNPSSENKNYHRKKDDEKVALMKPQVTYINSSPRVLKETPNKQNEEGSPRDDAVKKFPTTVVTSHTKLRKMPLKHAFVIMLDTSSTESRNSVKVSKTKSKMNVLEVLKKKFKKTVTKIQ